MVGFMNTTNHTITNFKHHKPQIMQYFNSSTIQNQTTIVINDKWM